MTGTSRHQEDNNDHGTFQWFLHSEVSGSVVLLACTIVALVVANSPWAGHYFHLLETKIGVSWGDSAFKLSLHHWINDGLMVLFFFVVGLEIKRELVVGHLSSVRQAVLPVAAALGGMVVPAVIYAAVNAGGDGARGWGIPMATDIAFALGILALFGSRVPIGLKVFLTALAIADDLGAVAVIALVYTDTIRVAGLIVAGAFLAALLVAGRVLHVRSAALLLLLAVGVWVGVLASGVHATVAGVIVALVIPVRARIAPGAFLDLAEDRLERLRGSELTPVSMIFDEGQLDAIVELHEAAGDMEPPGLALEHALHPVQALVVLPLFALANAGVAIDGRVLDTLGSPVALGVVFGLALGKLLGIAALTWAVVRSGKAELPEGVTWPQIGGVGCLAGVGFTMSLFVSELAFAQPALVGQAKVGILAASLVAGIAGYAVLHKSLPVPSRAGG